MKTKFNPKTNTPLKSFYKDEGDLINEFCLRMDCEGHETVGESGGEPCYGCAVMDEWVEKFIGSHVDNFHSRVLKEIGKLKKENEILREAVEYVSSCRAKACQDENCTCAYDTCQIALKKIGKL